MKKVVLLAVVGLFLTSVATGLTSYEVALDRDVDDQEVEEMLVDGSYEIDFEDRLLTIDMSFRLNLTRTDMSETTVNDFRVTVMAPGSEPVTSKDVGSTTVKQGEKTYISWKTMKTKTDVLKLDYLLFQMNHTPRDTEGNLQGKRQITGRIATPRVLVNPQLLEFGTNVSEAFRGSQIYVNGSVEDIGLVNLSWGQSDEEKTFSVTDNRFGGWMPVPVDMTEGQQDVPITVKTGRGTVFEENLSLLVKNSPPELTMKHAESITEGNEFQVDVEVRDDAGIADVTGRFRNKTFDASDGTFVFPTNKLDPGVYPFTISVTDIAGERVSSDGKIVIVKERSLNSGIDENSPGNDGDTEYSENTSFLMNLVSSVRGFIEGLLFGG